MIVINTQNEVIGSSHLIERVDEQDEIELIKVHTGIGIGFYYIGTDDRNLYQVIGDENFLVPDNNKSWFYIDGEFIEKPLEPTQSLYDLI
jgi:hypothetical protein